MAIFSRMVDGINLDFPKDLEGVFANSDKTKCLEPTGNPMLINGNLGRMSIRLEDIPDNATAYCAGKPVYDFRQGGINRVYLPLQFYKPKKGINKK